MAGTLDGKKIAILATDGVEQVELDRAAQGDRGRGRDDRAAQPRGRARSTASTTSTTATSSTVDKAVADASADDYDGLVIPGGVANGDFLRADEDAVRVRRRASPRRTSRSPSICHGPWILVEAGIVKGRTITSWPSLQTDIAQRRRHLGRRGGPRRPGPGHEPQAGRPPGLQREGRSRSSPRARTRTCRSPPAAPRRRSAAADRAIPPAPGGDARRMGDTAMHGTLDLDRRDQLRARHRPREALQRGPAQDGALPPAQRRDGRAHPAEARRPARRATRSPTTRLVKGYEIAPDRYVVIEPEELEALDPKKTKTIEIEDFVDARRHRPDLLRPPVLPRARARAAPSPTGCCSRRCARPARSAIAKVVIRQKEQLVAIRPMDGDVLGMATMIFADEVVDADRIDELDAAREVEVNDRELGIAKQLVESLSGDFEPDKYQRHLPRGGPRAHRAQGGRRGDRRPAGRARRQRSPVPDLMAALKASLDAVRERDGGDGGDDDDDEAQAQGAGQAQVAAPKKRVVVEEGRGEELSGGAAGLRRRAAAPSRAGTSRADARDARRTRTPRLRRADCSGPGIARRRHGRGFRYLDERRRAGHRRRGPAAHPRARHPAGLGGRVDLPVPGRPHPGHRHRRRRAQAVPLPPALARAPRPARSSTTWSSSPARCPACASSVDAAPARATTWAASTSSRAPCGCSTAASSASAARTTRCDNETYGLATMRKRHVRLRGDVLLFDYPAKHGKRRVQAVVDPRGGRRSSAALKRRRGGGDELLAYKEGRRWADVTLGRHQRVPQGDDRRGHLGQGLPHVGRDRAGRRRARRLRRARRRRRRAASARSRARSRRSPTTSATRRRSRARPTSTRACSTASATGARSAARSNLVAAEDDATAIQPVEDAVLELLTGEGR